LEAHDHHYGPAPVGSRSLIEEVARSGLRGRGGAGFPTATKLAAVASRRRPIVVVNATEGEPASHKDKVLLTVTPHLVMDGAVLAAAAVGADEVRICIDRSANHAGDAVGRAIDERASCRRDRVAISLHAAPDRYVAGEETALVQWLNGRDARPAFVPPRPFERGVEGRPTLVQNAETLAHVALIARNGADWFRTAGTARDPGTALLTVGGVTSPRVYEVPIGISLQRILEHAGAPIEAVGPVLVGGYFGTWLAPTALARTAFERSSLAAVGASPGCGVVAALPRTSCGLSELARVTRWLARENAGQCGPCFNGLPAIATAVETLYRGRQPNGALRKLQRWLDMVEGRGACKHPDGVVRFVRSGLRVLADDIEHHRTHGPCTASSPILPVPATGSWR
jgi:NADH:ubiquinone oxidoreductase subunit F (NADH-binding)